MPDLQETQHESFRLPADKDMPIWRYMDLAKYLSMLDRRGLFFSRATLLGDPFEGSSTKMMVAQREYVRNNRATDPALAAYKNMPETAFNVSYFYEGMVPKYLISCWHMNEHESAALWKLYSGSNEAVCIRSTYRRLRKCLPQWRAWHSTTLCTNACRSRTSENSVQYSGRWMGLLTLNLIRRGSNRTVWQLRWTFRS
jgi:hypothetical protein